MGFGTLVLRTPTFISDSKVPLVDVQIPDANVSSNPVLMIQVFHQLPELSDKKMDATNALFEPPLKHAKMFIFLVEIRLFMLESHSFLRRVGTLILQLKLKHYSAGIESDSEVGL